MLLQGDDAGVKCENFDWTTEDELEIENFQPSYKCLTVPNGETVRDFGEGSSYAGVSNSKEFDHLISMGFPGGMVAKVIEEYGLELAKRATQPASGHPIAGLGLYQLGQKARVEIQAKPLWPKPDPLQVVGFQG